jgi:hypothetical protein
MDWLSSPKKKYTNQSPEVKMLNKYFKKNFPFIIEVSDYVMESRRRMSSFAIDIYVSPQHFCELMDIEVERQVVTIMTKISSQFLKVLIPELDMLTTKIVFRFFPKIEEETILPYLSEFQKEL